MNEHVCRRIKSTVLSLFPSILTSHILYAVRPLQPVVLPFIRAQFTHQPNSVILLELHAGACSQDLVLSCFEPSNISHVAAEKALNPSVIFSLINNTVIH